MNKHLLLSLFTIIILFAAVTNSYTKKATPPVAKTGAPSEGTCGSTQTGCHNTTPNSGTGTLSVDFGQTTYTSGQVLTVTVTTSEAGKSIFGFEGTMLDGSNIKAGDFIITSPTTTSLQTSAGRQYIGHKAASTTNSWSFQWTAPSASTGPVTFYLTSICGNASNTAVGDNCYSISQVLEPILSSVHEVSNTEEFMIIGNTTSNNVSLNYNTSPNSNTLIRLLDINGRVVSVLVNQQTSGMHALTFTKPSIAGLYFVDYTNGNNHEVKKVLAL